MNCDHCGSPNAETHFPGGALCPSCADPTRASTRPVCGDVVAHILWPGERSCSCPWPDETTGSKAVAELRSERSKPGVIDRLMSGQTPDYEAAYHNGKVLSDKTQAELTITRSALLCANALIGDTANECQKYAKRVEFLEGLIREIGNICHNSIEELSKRASG